MGLVVTFAQHRADCRCNSSFEGAGLSVGVPHKPRNWFPY
jgi:hypothetical protein